MATQTVIAVLKDPRLFRLYTFVVSINGIWYMLEVWLVRQLSSCRLEYKKA